MKDLLSKILDDESKRVIKKYHYLYLKLNPLGNLPSIFTFEAIKFAGHRWGSRDDTGHFSATQNMGKYHDRPTIYEDFLERTLELHSLSNKRSLLSALELAPLDDD